MVYMRVLAEFREPLIGYEQKLVIVPVEELSVIEVQRKPSTYHVRRLAESMSCLLYTSPSPRD